MTHRRPPTRRPQHVLATIFTTAAGDPQQLAPKTITFDLSQWEGKKVRLRFAQVDNRGPLRAGIDDVRLEQIMRVVKRSSDGASPSRGPVGCLGLGRRAAARLTAYAAGSGA